MLEFEHHVFITGMTDSGKTTFASKYYESNDGLNIFFNVQEEYCVEKVSDIIVTNYDELVTAIEEGYTHICFNPELAGQDIPIEDISATIRMLFAYGTLAKDKAKGRPEIWCTVYIDEVQEYGEKGGHPVIHRISKRGLGYGIRFVSMSQRPADVSHTILTQSQDHVIFYVGGYEHPYFKRYNIPIEDYVASAEEAEQGIKKHLDHKWNFVIWWNQREIIPYNKLSI